MVGGSNVVEVAMTVSLADSVAMNAAEDVVEDVASDVTSMGGSLTELVATSLGMSASVDVGSTVSRTASVVDVSIMISEGGGGSMAAIAHPSQMPGVPRLSVGSRRFSEMLAVIQEKFPSLPRERIILACVGVEDPAGGAPPVPAVSTMFDCASRRSIRSAELDSEIVVVTTSGGTWRTVFSSRE